MNTIASNFAKTVEFDPFANSGFERVQKELRFRF
jgi:hypothetical protein